jgi:hypothetical protein
MQPLGIQHQNKGLLLDNAFFLVEMFFHKYLLVQEVKYHMSHLSQHMSRLADLMDALYHQATSLLVGDH